MKNIIIFGGSGGLGTELIRLIPSDVYNIISVSSKIVNITNFEEVDAFLKINRPDIVINLAGFNYDTFLHKIDAENVENVNTIIDVNIIGSINITACSLKRMREQGYGRLILISSILSRKVVIGTSIYSASKAFMDRLMASASAENINKGVTCNTIRLGYFDAGMCHRMPESIQEGIKNSIPLKRWGKIEELYSTIEYLINTEYITGQNIEISGGLL